SLPGAVSRAPSARTLPATAPAAAAPPSSDRGESAPAALRRRRPRFSGASNERVGGAELRHRAADLGLDRGVVLRLERAGDRPADDLHLGGPHAARRDGRGADAGAGGAPTGGGGAQGWVVVC